MSNDQNGVKNPSQRKMVRTDNGQYHVVYESMGTVWYTYSLTSDFYGAWSPDHDLTEGNGQAKNPAIDYDGNIAKIVFEYYDPQVGGDAGIYLVTGTEADFDEVTTYPSSYFGSAKPVISFTQYEIFVAYRDGTAGGIKQKTKWSEGGPVYDWYWDDEADIPGTNADCINPSVTGWRQPANTAFIHIAYENFGVIFFNEALRRDIDYGNHYWEYGDPEDYPVNLSALSGFNTNKYPVISLANQNSAERYLMVSWLGIYDANQQILHKKLMERNHYIEKQQ